MHRDPNFKKPIQVIFSHSNFLCSKAFFRLKIRAKNWKQGTLAFAFFLLDLNVVRNDHGRKLQTYFHTTTTFMLSDR